MNQISTIQQENQNANVAIFSPQSLAAIQSFAQVMASGVATIPFHLQNNASDCMAIAMQAAQWNMNPYAVAQKTFTVGGVLGYEAQLVNAVITTRGPLVTRIEYDWFGPWDRVVGKFLIKVNDKKKEYRVPGWKLSDEDGIGIKIWATLKGEEKPRELVLLLAQARTRNSTLWADDPRQQLAYLAVKRWARLYCPEVILGVYTADELEQRQEKEINPEPEVQERVNLRDIGEEVVVSHQHLDNEGGGDIAITADEFRASIDEAQTTDEARAIGDEIDEMKLTLGVDLHTELRNKAVKRYHQMVAQTKISTLINDLPNPDEPDAQQRFNDLEKSLQAAKSRLGADLYEGYCITLADMKPEYCS